MEDLISKLVDNPKIDDRTEGTWGVDYDTIGLISGSQWP